MEPEPRDHCRREDQRSTRPDDVEFDHKSRDSNAREDNRPRKQDDNEFPGQPRESRKYNDDDLLVTGKKGDQESTMKKIMHHGQEKTMTRSGKTDRIETILIDRTQKEEMILIGETRRGQEGKSDLRHGIWAPQSIVTRRNEYIGVLNII
ncbi:uncharacterized protein DS421_8g248650 [Arachis hypogaea]|nr:uncharacterized protein DS421_8g248650 [Arachis hypogaea]